MLYFSLGQLPDIPSSEDVLKKIPSKEELVKKIPSKEELTQLRDQPWGTTIAVGLLSASMAKMFPGKFLLPFLVGSVAGYLTGIVKLPGKK